ncbi:MAG: methyltransferase domain-containing protein [Solirubrobacterales bacterium]
MARTTTDWQASAYHRVAAPQEAWARELLDRMDLEGGEAVLDAGCGSGRATALLLERLPRGRVIGVDGSPSMIGEARANLATWGDRVGLILCDLCDLRLAEPVDGAFSNATFHWISDHQTLFVRLASALRPGGRLVAQCGGRGNVETYREAIEAAAARPEFSAAFAGWPSPWNFAGLGETEERLLAAGFSEARCWLEEKTVEPESPRDFIGAVGLAAHHERLDPERREAFTETVLEELPRPLVLDYVRLNIEARAGGGAREGDG